MLLVAGGMSIAPPADGQEDLNWSEAGVRAGYIETSSGSFRQFEVYVVHPMRTRIELLDDWVAQAKWEMSAGRLEHEGTDGLVFAAGPVVELRKGDEPWFLEIGSRPTLISEDDFDQKEFGGPFQFTSHGALGWSNDRFEVSYRIQHMSNARIYGENDGLNLHVLSMGLRF